MRQYRMDGIAAALAIQGHHIGLQKAEEDALREVCLLAPELAQRASARFSESSLDLLLQRFAKDGLSLPEASVKSEYGGLNAPPAGAMLDVRMLYSALVDADYLATEAHFEASGPDQPFEREAGPDLHPKIALDVLLEYLGALASDSRASAEVNRVRADLLSACLQAASSPPGQFTLTAPTGAGKTLSLLAFALKHASEHNLRRIVVVIPFLSIIEQTVQEYHKALKAMGERCDLAHYVLEDHSLAGTREADQPGGDANAHGQARLLAENWDAPIVVTTSVQCLESLFANRPWACRKLHRLARSVIIFDEVQTLPTRLAVPTLATLSRLTERYGASVVFSTATQPAFTHLNEAVCEYCAGGWQPREIAPPTLRLFERLRRTRVVWPRFEETPLPWDDLAQRLVECERVLCIVNLKRHAMELIDRLQQTAPEGLLHLSTSMCPAHRREALDKVRQRLDAGQPCRLISTQCIEAGVDVDFPVVFRAWGPLDAIAQAAGRCNRNGRDDLGEVQVFVPADEGYPDGGYRQAADVARLLLRARRDEEMDIQEVALFDEYYRSLYALRGVGAGDNDELCEAVCAQDFVDVAQRYRVIQQDTINVLVPYEVTVFQQLTKEVMKTGLRSDWIAQARPFTVGVYRPHRDSPMHDFLEAVPVKGDSAPSDDWFVYLDKEGYDPLVGLKPRANCLIA
jgi:CRISPR-associated helicase Cas3